MKHSNFALAILSAIILSACGSSSSNDNQSVDPTPTPTPNQNSNTTTPTPTPTPAKPISPAANPNPESIPQQQSSSNANNNQPISSQTTPIVKAKPNPKTAGGSKQKQNKGQGNTPAAGKNPIKAPDLTGLAAKPEAELKKLLDEAIKAEGEAHAKKAKVDKLLNSSDPDYIPTKIAAAKNGDIAAAITAVENAVSTLKTTPNEVNKRALAEELVKLEQAKEKLQELTDKLKQARKDQAEQGALEQVAKTKKEAYQNALAAQKAEKEDPEAVIEAKKAREEYLKLLAEQQAAEGNKGALDAEIDAIKDQVKALEDKNEVNKKVTGNQNTPTDVKEKLEAETKANDEKIAQLKKDQKEKEEAVKAADKKAKLIKVDADAAKDVANDAKDAAKLRGVYSSTGTYDESTSYKNVKKVSFKGTTLPTGEWVLSLKDGDKEVKINIASITNELGGGSKKYGKFGKIDSKDILVNTNYTNSIYGYIGDDFFSAGEVSENGPNMDITFNSSTTGFNVGYFKTKGKTLIADVTGATYKNSEKKLTGKFTNFRQYSTNIGGVMGTINDSVQYTDGDFFTGSTTEVGFTAKVEGNKFTPIVTPKEAKVYGYFYGTDAKEIGGLVEHDKFNGVFGAKKD